MLLAIGNIRPSVVGDAAALGMIRGLCALVVGIIFPITVRTRAPIPLSKLEIIIRSRDKDMTLKLLARWAGSVVEAGVNLSGTDSTSEPSR